MVDGCTYYLQSMKPQQAKHNFQVEQSQEATSRRIKKKFNVYMSQNSQYNPFGPNSIASTYEQKLKYKYNMMKDHIKLTRKDAFAKEYEQSRFLGVMVLGFAAGYFAAFALTAIITKGKNIKMNEGAKWDYLTYPLLMTGGFGYQYMAAEERYNKKVCEYTLNKYLGQAIENGFEDYQISK